MSSAVPEGWFLKSLDEISIFIKDGTHGTHERLNEGIPLLSAKNISSDGHINCDSGDSLISEIDYQKIHAKYAIEKDDLLLTVVGTLGRTALVPEGFLKFTLQRSVAVIRLDAKTIHPELCYQYLRGDDFQRQLSLRSNSTAQAGVYLGELARISVPIPPLPEQKKIASILTSVDEVIENTQKQIDKLQDLKKATMNELLTKGIGHTEFKDSELGRIPKSWEVVTLNQVKLDISDGNYSSKYPSAKEFVAKGIPFLRANNIGELTVDGSNLKFISEKKHQELRKGHLRNGDILLSNRGQIGKTCIVQEQFVGANINAQVVRVNGQDDINHLFLFYSLRSDVSQRQFGDLETGTALKQLPIGNLLKLKLKLPPKEEQVFIGNKLWSIDSLILSVKTKLSQTQSLKKSLMQDLLTGKVRVTVN